MKCPCQCGRKMITAERSRPASCGTERCDTKLAAFTKRKGTR